MWIDFSLIYVFENNILLGKIVKQMQIKYQYR